MTLPASRKKANIKWDKENMSTVACRLKKAQADKFKAYAQAKGTTANSLLKEYIMKCIED